MQNAINEFHESLEQFLLTKTVMLATEYPKGESIFEQPTMKAYGKARTRYRAAVRDLADALQATDQRVRIVLLGSSLCPYCGMTADDEAALLCHLDDIHPLHETLEANSETGTT